MSHFRRTKSSGRSFKLHFCFVCNQFLLSGKSPISFHHVHITLSCPGYQSRMTFRNHAQVSIFPSPVRNPDTIVSCIIAMHIGPNVTQIRATRNIVLRLQYTLWIIWSAERASRWRCANAADKEECNIPSFRPEQVQREN